MNSRHEKKREFIRFSDEIFAMALRIIRVTKAAIPISNIFGYIRSYFYHRIILLQITLSFGD